MRMSQIGVNKPMIKLLKVLSNTCVNDTGYLTMTAQIACSGQLQRLPACNKISQRDSLLLRAEQRMWISDPEKILAAHGFPYITAADSINAKENTFTLQFSIEDKSHLTALGNEVKKMLYAFSPKAPSYNLTITGISEIQLMVQNGYHDIWIKMAPDTYQIDYDIPSYKHYSYVWGKGVRMY